MTAPSSNSSSASSSSSSSSSQGAARGLVRKASSPELGIDNGLDDLVQPAGARRRKVRRRLTAMVDQSVHLLPPPARQMPTHIDLDQLSPPSERGDGESAEDAMHRNFTAFVKWSDKTLLSMWSAVNELTAEVNALKSSIVSGGGGNGNGSTPDKLAECHKNHMRTWLNKMAMDLLLEKESVEWVLAIGLAQYSPWIKRYMADNNLTCAEIEKCFLRYARSWMSKKTYFNDAFAEFLCSSTEWQRQVHNTFIFVLSLLCCLYFCVEFVVFACSGV